MDDKKYILIKQIGVNRLTVNWSEFWIYSGQSQTHLQLHTLI